MSQQGNSEITRTEWNTFTNVITDMIKKHPETGFIKTMALKLNDDVYHAYKVSFLLTYILDS